MNQESKVFKFFNSSEEIVSMFLGLVIVVVVGGLVFNYFQKNRGMVNIPGISDQKVNIGEKLNNNSSTQQEIINKNEYVVFKGDSLWKIAQNYYGDGNRWGEIANENKIVNPSMLVSGQKLTLPGERGQVQTQIPSPTIVVKTPSPEEKTYTVVTGDNLWKIAQNYYGDGNRWGEIANENKIVNPKTIVVGQVLKLPTQLNGDSYTLVKGDSLWKIAVNTYGDGYKWINIWNNNKNILRDPNKIEVGTKLILPKM